MLNKPIDYDQTEGFGGFEQIALGGHEMIIKKVEVVNSSGGKPMLKVSLDTAPTDSQPSYFSKRWRNDTRQNKVWGCVYNQLIYNDDGTTNRGFKTILTCVEESNDGYRTVWGEGFEASLTGKLVGGVFGQEEFLNDKQERKMSTKLRFFRSIRQIRDGVEVPEPKMLQSQSTPFPSVPSMTPAPFASAPNPSPIMPMSTFGSVPAQGATGGDGFSAYSNDEELPF